MWRIFARYGECSGLIIKLPLVPMRAATPRLFVPGVPIGVKDLPDGLMGMAIIQLALGAKGRDILRITRRKRW